MLEISIENKNISIEVNQSIEDVIDSSFKIDDIVAAKIDNELVDLSYSIDKKEIIYVIITTTCKGNSTGRNYS